MCEVMENYAKEYAREHAKEYAKEYAREYAREHAKEYAKEYVKESTIRSYIEACKEFTEAKDATIKRVSNKFGLSQSEAAEKVAMYWN